MCRLRQGRKSGLEAGGRAQQKTFLKNHPKNPNSTIKKPVLPSSFVPSLNQTGFFKSTGRYAPRALTLRPGGLHLLSRQADRHGNLVESLQLIPIFGQVKRRDFNRVSNESIQLSVYLIHKIVCNLVSSGYLYNILW